MDSIGHKALCSLPHRTVIFPLLQNYQQKRIRFQRAALPRATFPEILYAVPALHRQGSSEKIAITEWGIAYHGKQWLFTSPYTPIRQFCRTTLLLSQKLSGREHEVPTARKHQPLKINSIET